MSSAALSHRPPTFQDLLRNWRKTRKLSQWSLSMEAGISQRHLSFLESGRSSPSRDMVLLLGRSLELPLREQNALLHAAGYAPVFSHAGLEEDTLRQARHALEVMLKHHEPYPAVVLDKHWNILMMNEANLKVFSLFIDPVNIWEDISPGKAPNILRLTLHPRGIRSYLQNWQELASYFRQHMASDLAANPYDSQARELLQEMDALPDMPDFNGNAIELKPFISLRLKKGDVDLEFFSMISTFGTPLDVTLQEIRIETFFAGNPETETAIKAL